jgi:hypothetical protein
MLDAGGAAMADPDSSKAAIAKKAATRFIWRSRLLHYITHGK